MVLRIIWWLDANDGSATIQRIEEHPFTVTKDGKSCDGVSKALARARIWAEEHKSQTAVTIEWIYE